MSKLAEAIAHQEGFYVVGSLPNRNNNPGDLRHGNAETHPDNQPNSVGSFATPELGWAALERQLILDSTDTPHADRSNWTIQDLVNSYAPPGPPDFNNTEAYLEFVCNYCQCSQNDLVSTVLQAQ